MFYPFLSFLSFSPKKVAKVLQEKKKKKKIKPAKFQGSNVISHESFTTMIFLPSLYKVSYTCLISEESKKRTFFVRLGCRVFDYVSIFY